MEDTLEVLKTVTRPFDEFHDKKTGGHKNFDPENFLHTIVEEILTSSRLTGFYATVSENCGPKTASWKFTLLILDILLKVKGDIERIERERPPSEKDIEVLSLQSQFDVQKCLEMITGFGVLPYLLRDVGVPQEVRKANQAASEIFLLADHHLPPIVQFYRLAQVIDTLLELCELDSLRNIILPKHCADLLAALLQVSKAPISKPVSSSECTTGGRLTFVEYEHVMQIRARFNSILSVFLQKIPFSLLLNALLLIGRKPKFMRQACSELVSKLILLNSGLVMLAITLLSDASASESWNLSRIISNLMITAMKSAEKPFENFCEQCIQMIAGCELGFNKYLNKSMSNTNAHEESVPHSSGVYDGTLPNLSGSTSVVDPAVNDSSRVSLMSNLKVNKVLREIGVFCSVTLMDLNCEETKRLVWNRLFRPVYLLGESQPQMSFNNANDELFVPANEPIITCVDIAEILLSVIIPAEMPFPVKILQPLWTIFFKLFVCCKLYSKKKVQDTKISHFAMHLGQKLNNIFLLLVEVLASGESSKVNKDCDTKTANKANPKNVKKTDKILHVSEKDAELTCRFLLDMIVQDNGDVEEVGVSYFELQLTCEDDKESVKIIPVGLDSSTSLDSAQSSENINIYENLSNESVVLSSLLLEERLSHITSLLFCQLLSHEHHSPCSGDISEQASRQKVSFNKSINSLGSLSGDNKDAVSCSDLTSLELKCKQESKSSLRKFVVLKLLELLGDEEQIVEQLATTEDYTQILQIVELVLKKVVNELKHSSLQGENYEFRHTVVFVLGFLGTVVETAASSSALPTPGPDIKLSSGDFWQQLNRFIPLLRTVTEFATAEMVSSGLVSMAENILIGIQTEGKGLGQPDKVKEVISEYKKALSDVANPMIPVKGHGLLQLRKLLESNDKETLENDEHVLKLFHEHLSNDDSYVYLMAVQGLAALGCRFHQLVVPVLMSEYDFVNPDKVPDSCPRSSMYANLSYSEKVDCRMKIGEVLVRIIQKLGDMAPTYRVPLCNLFFRVLRDEEPLIRASALSNLGELCHVLKFSLKMILTEVWHNIQSVLNCEKNPHVRRSALHLLVLLLRGVETEISNDVLLTDLELGTYLRDVRRLLTLVESTEEDLVAKTHAQLALDELGLIVRKLLLPRQDIKYKIRVLDLNL